MFTLVGCFIRGLDCPSFSRVLRILHKRTESCSPYSRQTCIVKCHTNAWYCSSKRWKDLKVCIPKTQLLSHLQTLAIFFSEKRPTQNAAPQFFAFLKNALCCFLTPRPIFSSPNITPLVRSLRFILALRCVDALAGVSCRGCGLKFGSLNKWHLGNLPPPNVLPLQKWCLIKGLLIVGFP